MENVQYDITVIKQDPVRIIFALYVERRYLLLGQVLVHCPGYRIESAGGGRAHHNEPVTEDRSAPHIHQDYILPFFVRRKLSY